MWRDFKIIEFFLTRWLLLAILFLIDSSDNQKYHHTVSNLNGTQASLKMAIYGHKLKKSLQKNALQNFFLTWKDYFSRYLFSAINIFLLHGFSPNINQIIRNN